ncbi:hypothetical protein FRC02_001526 [Tulasnella sp. 418]|nr:hypothetical protein FRC02_001526 [Tulasnella sp. 418]
MYDPNPPNPLAKTAAEWTDRSSAWSKFQPGAPSEALIITLDVVDESLWSVPAPGLKAAVEDLLEVIKSIRVSLLRNCPGDP